MATFSRSDDLRGAKSIDVNLRGTQFVKADSSDAVMRGILVLRK